MKLALLFLFSLVLCLVRSQPLLRGSDTQGTLVNQAGVGVAAGCTPGVNNAAKPPPNLVDSLAGNDPSSPWGPPPPGGDFVVSYDNECDPIPVKYGGCVPYEKNGHSLNYAKFSELVECFGYQDDVCKTEKYPIPAPFPDKLNLPNILDTGKLLAKSYNCYKLGTYVQGTLKPSLGQDLVTKGTESIARNGVPGRTNTGQPMEQKI